MALRDRMKGIDRDDLHPQGAKSKKFVEWVHDYLVEVGLEEATAYEAALEIWKETRIKGT